MKKNIRVAIDISPTIDGNSSRGVGFYTSRLISSLQRVVATNKKYRNFKISLIKTTSLNPNSFDLIHYPFFDPYKNTLPDKTIPTIVTVHDLIPRDFKQHFPAGIKGEITWQMQKRRLKKVDLIITDSISSKFSIHKNTDYPLDWIYSIPLAADTDFYPLKSKPTLNLPKKFVLFTGDINWNKNIPHLAQVCINLKTPLIIVGKTASQDLAYITKHPWTESLIQLKENQEKYPKLIITPGFVDNKTLNSYYNLATCYCQPSYAEGFGLPLLEAMQAGCPIVWSDRTSLPEIAENTGLCFNPNSYQDLYEKLKKMIDSTKLQKESRASGIKRSKIFSWEFTAIQTLEAYNLTLTKNDKA